MWFILFLFWKCFYFPVTYKSWCIGAWKLFLIKSVTLCIFLWYQQAVSSADLSQLVVAASFFFIIIWFVKNNSLKEFLNIYIKFLTSNLRFDTRENVWYVTWGKLRELTCSGDGVSGEDQWYAFVPFSVSQVNVSDAKSLLENSQFIYIYVSQGVIWNSLFFGKGFLNAGIFRMSGAVFCRGSHPLA